MSNTLYSNSTNPAQVGSLPMHRYYKDEVTNSSTTQYYPYKTSSGTETRPTVFTDYSLHPGSADDARIHKNRAMIKLLRAWREEDEQEQRTTWELLKEALEEDRWSDRELFPCPE